jgi:hypothetical protein
MPSRTPVRRAARRTREHTERITTAPTDRSKALAAVGWLMAEFHKIPHVRRPYWISRWVALAQEMNKETRDDSQ